MRESLIVWDRVAKSLKFFQRMGAGKPWHVQVGVESDRLNVSDVVMRRTLVWLAQKGYVRLTSWSYSLRREADYWEFPTSDAFFFNRDDCNYVRVMPLIGF
jgi:hypothetical protein